MPEPAPKNIREAEQRIQTKLEQIQSLVERQAPLEPIQKAFEEAVSLFTDKYLLLLFALEQTRTQIPPGLYEQRAELLQNAYQEDLANLAVSIDEARGATPATSN